MAKKVSFGRQEKPAAPAAVSPDKWVDTGSVAEVGKGETIRFTIDLPAGLHQRIKIYCALNKVKMKDVIIEMFEGKFPPLPNG
mgnify:CR=1 FL=1